MDLKCKIKYVHDRKVCICASDKGSLARFINHSCDPNAFAVQVVSHSHS